MPRREIVENEVREILPKAPWSEHLGIRFVRGDVGIVEVDLVEQPAFGDALGDPLADEILRLLRAAPNGLTKTDIHDHSAAQINRALGSLLEFGLARYWREETGQRPREQYAAVQTRTNLTNYTKNCAKQAIPALTKLFPRRRGGHVRGNFFVSQPANAVAVVNFVFFVKLKPFGRRGSAWTTGFTFTCWSRLIPGRGLRP